MGILDAPAASPRSVARVGAFRPSPAIRNMALPDAGMSVWPTLAASVAASNTPPAGYQPWAMVGVDSRVRAANNPLIALGANGAKVARSPVNTIAQTAFYQCFDIAFRLYRRRFALRYHSNGGQFRLWVNGVPQAMTHQSVDNLDADRYVIFDFLTIATREIMLEGEFLFAPAGIACELDGALLPPSYESKGRLAVLGDSISFGYSSTGGALDNTFYHGWFRHCCRLLGLHDASQIGAAPGTGFIATTGTYPKFTDATRLQNDIIDQAPDAVLITASPNDYTAFTAPGGGALYDTAVRSVVTQLRAGLPDAQLIFSGALGAPYVHAAAGPMNAALEAIADDLGIPFIDTAYWMGSSIYVGDGTHPTEAGHAALAPAMAARLAPILGVAT